MPSSVTADGTGGSSRRRRQLASAAAVLLAVLAVGLVVVGVRAQQPAPPDLVRSEGAGAPDPRIVGAPSPAQDAAPRDETAKAIAPLEAAAPLEVVLPSLGVRSSLERLDLAADGTMQTPVDPFRAGWYQGSPAPGSLGPAVIAAHVTWDKRPSVFFKLGSVRPGQRVEVRRADRTTAVFTVTEVQQHPKDRFPTDAVYGTIEHAGLRLITCGGEFDSATSHYTDNIIVFAELTQVRPGP